MNTSTKIKTPYRSGFCADSNPPDSHARCPLEYRGIPCSCSCHMAPASTPPTEERGGQDEHGSQVLASHLGEPGFHPDIPEAEYHAHAGSLSHSGAKTLLKAPALFDYQRKHPVFKDAFDFGSAAHAVALGDGMDNIYVTPHDDWRTKQAQTERDTARADGLSPITAKDWLVVCDMAEQLKNHSKAMELFAVGQPEVSAFALDEETGVLMRCRYDWHRPGIGVDYKSTVEGGADPDRFVRSAFDLGYYTQQDWYCHISEILGQPLAGFGFVVQEKTAPYLVTVVELPTELVDLGRARNRIARERFRDCTESGIWPGYVPDDEIAQPSAPAWILRRGEAS